MWVKTTLIISFLILCMHWSVAQSAPETKDIKEFFRSYYDCDSKIRSKEKYEKLAGLYYLEINQTQGNFTLDQLITDNQDPFVNIYFDSIMTCINAENLAIQNFRFHFGNHYYNIDNISAEKANQLQEQFVQLHQLTLEDRFLVTGWTHPISCGPAEEIQEKKN